jgi:hypothetical protein
MLTEIEGSSVGGGAAAGQCHPSSLASPPAFDRGSTRGVATTRLSEGGVAGAP